MTEPEKPGLIRKVLNFTAEEALWIFHGRPFRAVEDINHIYYKICKQCQYHVKDHCEICGCRMVRMELSFLNKLAMATTNCPHPDGPQWVSDITPPEGMTPEHLADAVSRSHTVRVESQDRRFSPIEESDDKKKDMNYAENMDPAVLAVDGVNVKQLPSGQVVEGDL